VEVVIATVALLKQRMVVYKTQDLGDINPASYAAYEFISACDFYYFGVQSLH